MSNEANIKRGKGRPAGSTSFIRVNISDLINAVGQNARIVVSKKWLEEIGLTIETPVATLAPIREAVEEQPKIEFTLTPID
jgi:hypothetical protein